MRATIRQLLGVSQPSETPDRPIPGRRAITVGLLLALSVVAVETTVVTTALPTVIGELHGIELYAWVFSAYLLTSTITIPIFGKLADLYGRKPIFLGGMAVFLVGSLLCGLADSVPRLIAFRALQGLGAGAVTPLVFTITGDVYSLRERGTIQGLMQVVWGIASLGGPALGAYLTLTWSWRWVFFINLPFGLLAAWFIWRLLRETVDLHAVKIDYAGAAAIAAGLLALLVAALEGGHGLAWGSPAQLGLVALSGLLLALFVWIERRAAAPVLPLSLFRSSIMSVTSVGNLLQGAQLFALTAYIPLYVQGVRGESAAGAGAALTPLMVAWSLSGTFGPRVLLRFGFRTTALLGTGLLFAGSLPLLLLDAWKPTLLIAVSMALLGTGFGQTSTAFLVAVQSAVPWELRGVATSSTQLFRNLGGAVGVALLGALVNGLLQAALGGGTVDSGALLDPTTRAALGPAQLATLQSALAEALKPVFAILLALAAVNLLAVALFARDDLKQKRPDGDTVGAETSESAGVP